jgi:hypothetical protein
VADESTIRTAALADAGVAALIGDRLYDQRVPESKPVTTPYVVMRVISAVPLNTIDSTPGVDDTRMQFDIIDTTKAGAKAVHSALRIPLANLGYELLSMDGLDEATDRRRIISDWSFWLAR